MSSVECPVVNVEVVSEVLNTTRPHLGEFVYWDRAATAHEVARIVHETFNNDGPLSIDGVSVFCDVLLSEPVVRLQIIAETDTDWRYSKRLLLPGLRASYVKTRTEQTEALLKQMRALVLAALNKPRKTYRKTQD